jgi:hypothetical protein
MSDKGTRFVVDLGSIALPEEEARALEAEIQRVVLDALARLDLAPRPKPRAEGFDPFAPLLVMEEMQMLPEGEIYGLLVPPDEPREPHRPPPAVDENPF